MAGRDPLLEKIIQVKAELLDLFLEHYFKHELFGWTWWITVAMFVVPLVVWWKRGQTKALEICVFGLLNATSRLFSSRHRLLLRMWSTRFTMLPINGCCFRSTTSSCRLSA